MKPIVVAFLLMILAGAAVAQPGGLTGAIERQRQDSITRQGESRRETERQGESLQQQQERSLQLQLLQRQQQPAAPPVPPNCSRVGSTLACQ